MHRTFQIMLLILTIFFLTGRTANTRADDKPKLLTGVSLWDCLGCHITPAGPAQHPDYREENNKDCGQCHEPGKKTSLRGKLPLSHLHLAAGVSCEDCHGARQPFKGLATEQCRTCHGGPEKMEALTRDLHMNPHSSPHYGNEMDCDMCHHQHRTSENVCHECHDPEGVTP